MKARCPMYYDCALKGPPTAENLDKVQCVLKDGHKKKNSVGMIDHETRDGRFFDYHCEATLLEMLRDFHDRNKSWFLSVTGHHVWLIEECD